MNITAVFRTFSLMLDHVVLSLRSGHITGMPMLSSIEKKVIDYLL